MEVSASGGGMGPPELLVDRLSLRLRRHAFWDFFLVLFPPISVLSYLSLYLLRAAWIGREALFLSGIALAGVALILVGLRSFFEKPKASLAARFIDEKVAAEERFLTLTTLSPAHSSSPMMERLRQEATAFLDRIDLRRDFPYRVKRSFVASLIGSLAVILLFHLILLVAVWFVPPLSPTKELLLLSEKLAQVPHLSSLARDIQSLINKLENEKLPGAEKQSLIQEVQEKVENQHKVEPQEDQSQKDLLNQAGNALKNLEQGEKQKQEQEQQEGGGGITTNLPDQGEGQNEKQSKAGGKEESPDPGAQSSDAKGGQNAQGETKEPSDPQKDGGKGQGQKTDDKGRDEKQKGKESDLAKSQQEGGSGKVSEEIPQGSPPPDRFLKPGEQGEGGIKGARYVTVELPEAEAERALGTGGSTKRKPVQPKLPVSNVPLRQPDSPEASAEKQPLPLEYRGLIR
jgi:hypothetical protein